MALLGESPNFRHSVPFRKRIKMAYCISSTIQYKYCGSSGNSKGPRRRTHLKLKRLLQTVHRYRSNPDMRPVNSVTNKSHYQTYFDVSIVKTHYLHRIVRHVVSED
jgi:hypothetical protein